MTSIPPAAFPLNDISASRMDLIYNDTESNKKVLTTLQKEISDCDRFDFSVAFITRSGMACINQLLDNTRDKVRGRIITTDYLNFSEPAALRQLLKFSNIEVRIYSRQNFHTKGYIFHKGKETSLMVGSSNITQDALNVNKEWNVWYSTHESDNLFLRTTVSEFESMWKQSVPLTEAWIQEYEPRHLRSKIERQTELQARRNDPVVITPNEMQKDALENLCKLRNSGADKALLISATGTGKTYLSAFDVKESHSKKVLFLVHREQILDDARESYKDILGDGIKTGKITGTNKDFDADYIFSTIQTMSKPDILAHFKPDHFDYIICDEAHHAVAKQYNRIVDYFRPKFMLGMTATPERMDSGDVFKRFNHNIAYEIRLQDALEKNMLCPFHYYGITDISVDGRPIEDDEDFNSLVSEERIKHIIEKMEFYGHSGDRVKGLIFCRSIEEGRELSVKLNEHGLRTQFVCGKDDAATREKAVNLLEQEDKSTGLDYIITVDIFNEGVDIKSVNQIVMLRPTQSSIIFIQQLGRGLRKRALNGELKEYLVVIDFIGNYKNNFMIPIALSGERSANKEHLRRYLMKQTIPGCSTVDFDLISKKRIYDSINRSTVTDLIKGQYSSLVKMLGYEPTMTQLVKSSSMDPMDIIDHYNNFNNFKRVLKLTHHNLGKEEEIVLDYLSSTILNGKRPHELEILNNVISHGCVDLSVVRNELADKYGIDCDEDSLQCAIDVLDRDYSKRLKSPLIEIKEGKAYCTQYLKDLLSRDYMKEYVLDIVDCGLEIFDRRYKEGFDGSLKLYERYSRKDVCRLLNLGTEGISSTIYGYGTYRGKCPIFVTYNKDENISKSIQYKEEFTDRQHFSWMTRSNRNIKSNDVACVLDPNVEKYFFVQKGDDDSSDFYYLGKVTPQDPRETTIEGNKGEALPIVNIKLVLEQLVDEGIYEYLTN